MIKDSADKHVWRGCQKVQLNFQERRVCGDFFRVFTQWGMWEAQIPLKKEEKNQFLAFLKKGERLTSLTQSAKPSREKKRPENTFPSKMPVLFFFILNADIFFFLVWIITSCTFRSDSTAAHSPKHLANLTVFSSNNLRAWESTGTSSFHASDLFKNRYKVQLTRHNRNNIVPAVKPQNGKKSWKYYPFSSSMKKKKSRRASEDDFGHADLASKTLKEK